MRILNFVILLTLGCFFFSCVLPFDPESFDFEKVIVVDGEISDELKYHEVLLSYTSPIAEDETAPLRGATVWVENSEGAIIPFEENQPGSYITTQEVAGHAGLTYQLFFTTIDDRTYLSQPATLLSAPSIDSVYQRYVEIITEESTYLSKGIQFFVDSENEEGDAKYFRYEWEEYYKLMPPYVSRWIFNEQALPEIVIYPRTESQSPCYVGKTNKQLLLYSTASQKKNNIREFPIRYITEQTEELSTRYSILVKQFAIDESAYGYYRRLKESSESGGSLFDKQQGTIAGNMSSVGNPKETVLGYFNAAGVSTIRRFFNPNDFDPRYTSDYAYSCDDGVLDILTDSVPFYIHGNNWQVIDYHLGKKRLYIASRRCTACSWFATMIPPYFWEE